MNDSTRYTGKIIFLDPKGFGFINSSEVPFERIFFHWSALIPPVKFLKLSKGQEVTFQTIEFPDKGLRAIKIMLVEKNDA